MVVTGNHWNDDTDLNDLTKPRQGEILRSSQDNVQRCDDLTVDFPNGIEEATGVLLHDKYHTICGGHDSRYVRNSNCYVFTGQSWEHLVSMTEERSASASIGLNSSSIWVTGGFNGNRLSSTEIIKISGDGRLENAEMGPSLPERSVGHCLVALTETTTMALGSWFDKRTHIYDWASSQWTKGPRLNKGNYRGYPGCGHLKDTSTGKE